jgi:hypothetical protein
MFILLLQNVLLLLLWPVSAVDAQANSQDVFIGHNYFHKKTKQHLNAGRYPARITACRT